VRDRVSGAFSDTKVATGPRRSGSGAAIGPNGNSRTITQSEIGGREPSSKLGAYRSLAFKDHGSLKRSFSEFFRNFYRTAQATGVDPRLSGLFDNSADHDG
jgi:hypothetical protein